MNIELINIEYITNYLLDLIFINHNSLSVKLNYYIIH